MQQSALEIPSRALIREQGAQLVERPTNDSPDLPGLDLSLNRLYYHSDAKRPNLRVGVMVDGPRIQLFMRKVLEDIRQCDFADLVCVIQNCEQAPAPAHRLPAPLRAARTLLDSNRRRVLAYQTYLRLLDRRYVKQPDPRSLYDCTDLFDGVRRIDVSPIRTRFVHRFTPDAVEALKALDLDVVLRFGFRIIRGEVLNIARHGVWSFHHGDSERYRGGPALLWELMESSPLSGAVLQKLDDALDAGPVLCRAVLASCPRLSVSVNRFNVYWSTQHFVIRKLYELHRFGLEHIAERTLPHWEYLGKRAIYRTPANLDMVRWLAPAVARTAVRKLTARDQVMHWRIALRRTTTPLWRQPKAGEGFSWIESPPRQFWADPFLFQNGSDTWMFFEDFNYVEKHGVIACGKVEEGGLKEVRTVLKQTCHLSYPYVFRHQGAVWMIPESAQARQIQLYRARNFPDDWVLERTLLDLRAVDSTPFEFQGRWWMFVTPMIVESHASITLLFEAPEPWGPWTLHPASPVCSDERWSRCAGQIIRDGHRLLRPSQNCTVGYGYSICFNEVKVLNARQYEEERGAQLLPDALSVVAGVHTFSRAGDWEAIDGRAGRPRSRVM